MGFAALSNSADGFHSVQHCLENLFSSHASKPQRILLIGGTSAYTVSCQLPFLHSLPSQFPTPVVILGIIPDKISYQALLKIHQRKLWAILFGKYWSFSLFFIPLSQNGSFLEPELQMCSVSGKHFWVLLEYKL